MCWSLSDYKPNQINSVYEGFNSYLKSAQIQKSEMKNVDQFRVLNYVLKQLGIELINSYKFEIWGYKRRIWVLIKPMEEAWAAFTCSCRS